MNPKKDTNNVRFVSTFENYEKERSGIKRNHVVNYLQLARSKKLILNAFIKSGVKCSITIQKGYTDECFTRKLKDVTIWDYVVIMSW